MNNYEAKQEARRERLEARAARLHAESDASIERGNTMLDAIPFGQPIAANYRAVADRNYRARAVGAISRGIELEKQAEEVERRAEAVGTGGISSDDPDAISKLTTQLEKLTDLQETMKKANAAIRRNDDVALAELGFTPEQIIKLKQPDFIGRIGFPNYTLTNNNANIRRIQQRIEQLQARDNAPAFETIQGNGWRCENLREDNRIAFYFDAIPPEETRKTLKGWGFKWSPTRGAWVRMDNNSGRYAAKMIIRALKA